MKSIRKLSILYCIAFATLGVVLMQGVMLMQGVNGTQAIADIANLEMSHGATRGDSLMVAGESMALAPASAKLLVGASTVGDFIWHDVNLDGQIGVTETGINSVTVELYQDDGDGIFELDGSDTLLSALVTGDNPETPSVVEAGWYDFDVDFGANVLHWINIPEVNFAPLGALEDYGLTSGGTIYPIPGLVIEQQPVADRNDFDFGFAQLRLTLEKTVYAGHDSGTACTGSESIEVTTGTRVTYCFTLINSGETYLINPEIDDAELGITQADMTLLAGSTPLTPTESLVYYYETTATGSLLNLASAKARPSDESGNEFSDLPDLVDDDTARVTVQQPGVTIEKSVYVGHNNGASCSGTDSVANENGANITYCFHVLNTGGTYLSSVAISDPNLNIDQTDMVLLSGVIPLAPASSLVYYYETTINGDLINTATVTANPTDETGNDLPEFGDQESTDSAEVDEISPQIEITKTVYLGHDNGISCPGGSSIIGGNGSAVTYCFEVANRGDTYLNEIVIQDTSLGITQEEMTQLSGQLLLPPNESQVYYYQSLVNGDLINIANVAGNPTDQNGTDIPSVTNPTSTDSAEVDSQGPGIRLDKSVYIGHDSGVSCEGSQTVTGQNGSPITFCFKVTNTGDSFIDDITISDPAINIDQTDMTLFSGSVPLAPNATLLYYYDTLIDGDLQNTATVTGNPTDANGTDIPAFPDLTDDDTARVLPTLGSISGRVWNDLNGDGILDPGEPPLSGVTVVLNTGVQVTTNDDGVYLFDNLPDGIYSVIEFDLPDYVSTNDANGGIDNLIFNIQITDGNDVTDQDFLDTLPLGSISGIVILDLNNDGVLTDDEIGIPGITVTLSNGLTVISDEEGHYQFNDLLEAEYVLTVSDPPGYKPTSENSNTLEVSLEPGQEIFEQNFFYNIISSITGIVFEDSDNDGVLDADESPLSNVELSLGDGTTVTTDEGGNYTFTSLQSGVYTITVGIVENYTSTTLQTIEVPIENGQDESDINFGFTQLMSLGNRVWFDLGTGNGVAGDGLINGTEQGAPGVTLQLLSANLETLLGEDGQPIQTETDENGYYLFDNLSPGTYIVWVIPQNFQTGGPLENTESTKTTATGTDIDGLDNGINDTSPIARGIHSFAVSLELRNETSLEVDLGPQADGSAAKANSNLTIDFGFINYLSLGNRVWLDDGAGDGERNNGLIDGDEAGLPNVVVNLLHTNGQPVLDPDANPMQTTTDTNGYYLFDGLLPASYIVQVDPSNFQKGGALESLINSVPTEEDPNADGDLNDNGIDEDTPGVNGIRTGNVELSYGSEVLRENDQGDGSGNANDSNSNLTIDFGFFVGEPDEAKAVTLVHFTTVREEDSIIIQWMTSAEVGTYGFHLFRSPAETSQENKDAQSERVQITNNIILGQGPSGGEYSYRDYSVEKGIEYTYYLQETEVDGTIIEVDKTNTVANSGALFLPVIEN